MNANSHRHLLVAASLLTIIAIGVLVVRRDPAKPEPTAAHTVAVSESTPTPTASAPDRGGADVAAADAVRASAAVATAGPLTRRDLVLALATERYGPQLLASVNQQLDDLLATLAERGVTTAGMVWQEYPLAVRTEPMGADRHRVRVWSVLVFAPKTGSVPRQVWRTATIELAWEHGAWKVDRWDSATGPTPAPPPEIQVSTVAAITETATWPPAPGKAGT